MRNRKQKTTKSKRSKKGTRFLKKTKAARETSAARRNRKHNDETVNGQSNDRLTENTSLPVTPKRRKKKCFVISPIGMEGTPVREHADDVFDYIIKPAMDRCGVDAYRSDHLDRPGKISDQMFDALLKDDFCIAILTGYNPNVFYELAIAQAAGRPVIMLMEKGNDLPFDIQDLRCVYYDLRPRSLFDNVYENKIVEHIKNLEATDWSVPDLLTGRGAFIGGHSTGLTTFKTTAADYSGSSGWSRLLDEARDVLDMMGISLTAWKRNKGFAQRLRQKAQSGCRVRILLMDPANPAMDSLFNPAIPELNSKQVERDIESMCEYLDLISQECENVEVRQIRTGVPRIHLTCNDDRAVVITYLYSERSGDSPLWECNSDSQLYGTLRQEFQAFWQANA